MWPCGHGGDVGTKNPVQLARTIFSNLFSIPALLQLNSIQSNSVVMAAATLLLGAAGFFKGPLDRHAVPRSKKSDGLGRLCGWGCLRWFLKNKKILKLIGKNVIDFKFVFFFSQIVN